MERAPSGDPRFRAIFDAHHRELHAYCLRRLGVHDANEATADALLAAWRRVGESPDRGVRPWLFDFARHAVALTRRGRTHVRVVARQGVAVPVVPGGGALQLVRHPSAQGVHRELAGLREVDREVVQLEMWEGMTREEIAATLGLTLRSVEHRRRRAMARLAARFPIRAEGVDVRSIAERIEAADPVPSLDSFPHSAASSGALLALVDERHAPAGPLVPLDVDRPKGGARGLMLAGLIAAVPVLAVLFLVVGVVGPPERPARPPTTAPAPTLPIVRPERPFAPDTTVPAGLTLPADTPALEVVETMYARWSQADISGYRALIDDGIAGYNLASFDHSAWYRLISGVADVRSCFAVGPDNVHCTTTYYSGLAHGQELYREEVEFIVAAGRIVSIETPGQLGMFNSGFDRDGLVAYRNWVLANGPDRFEPLFAFATTILLHTPELRNAHQTLMDEYREETTPSESLRGAMPIKVIDTYYGRLAAGDPTGARLLVTATSTDAVELVPTDREVWYSDVTGVAMGRICDTISTIQVQCDVTLYSGLEPGAELTGRLLLYTVIDGLIVDIEALGPLESVETTDEAGLALYRAWLTMTDPDAAAVLFTDEGTIELDTDDSRTAHRRYMARYRKELAG